MRSLASLLARSPHGCRCLQRRHLSQSLHMSQSAPPARRAGGACSSSQLLISRLTDTTLTGCKATVASAAPSYTSLTPTALYRLPALWTSHIQHVRLSVDKASASLESSSQPTTCPVIHAGLRLGPKVLPLCLTGEWI